MRCPQCHFENVPHAARCFRCGSIMEPAPGRQAILPPRAAAWKKPFRRLRYRWARSRSARQATAAEWSRRKATGEVSFAMMARPILLSLVPGLAHAVQRRFPRIRWYVLGWSLLLAGGLGLYGSSLAVWLVGLAVGLHAGIAVDAAVLMRPGQTFRLRATGLVTLSLCLLGLYRVVAAVVFHDIAGGFAAVAVPDQRVEAGDFLLGRRSWAQPTRLTRGTQVLVDLVSWGWARPVAVFAPIVAQPGETLRLDKGVFSVNEMVLDPLRQPCRDSLKMSPCNSIGMSPLSASGETARRPDGEHNHERTGTTTDGMDGACNGRVVEAA